jgi:ankyrin repeat/protein kinase domain-containing protein 1
LLEEVRKKLEGISMNKIIPFSEIKLEKNFSSGGTCIVYKGHYKFLNVAVKKMSLHPMSMLDFKALINELLILDRLKHENIIMVYGFSVDCSGDLYIISHFYSKGNLRNFLKRGKVGFSQKMRLLFQVARAINFIHSMNPPILHRDIKPDNIFISDSQNAILGDFGISKEFLDFKEQNLQTETFSTMEYMSPETLNNKVYYKQTDTYSYGVLMFEVLTEESFSKKNGYEFIADICQNKYRPNLDKLDTQPRLQALIRHCWQENWKKRPEF